MPVLLVLTFLIPSITSFPLFAQTPLTTLEYDLKVITGKPGTPDMTIDKKDLLSLSFTSSPLKNNNTITPQPSNVPVSKTPGVLTPKNSAITVAETMPSTESILETTIVAILKTTKVPSTESDLGQPITASIHQTLGVTQPQSPIQTSQHTRRLIPEQATTTEIFTSSSTSENGPSTTKETETEESISLASKSYPTQPGQTTLTNSQMTSSKTQGFGIVLIIIIALLACISGIIFIGMFFNKRKKRRSENFSSSFRNGGSSKSKRKKGTDDDAWFGPVSFKGEEEDEAGMVGSKEVDGKREGEGVQVVLSTFMAKEEEKDGVNGSCTGAEEDVKKDAEVPLLTTDENVEKTVSSSPRLSSSIPPTLSETDKGEQNGSTAFCLTSAV